MESVINNKQSQGSTKNNKELIFFLITLGCFVLILALYLSFFIKPTLNNKPTTTANRPNTPFYNLEPNTQKINKDDSQPVQTVLTDLEFSGDFRPIGLVLKGFFDSFNSTESEIKIKNQLTNSTTLQLLSFNTSKLETFFCWPTTLPSDKGPIDIRTVEHGLSSPDAIIYNPDERSVPFDQMEVFLKPNSFMIMQLETEFNFERTNFIKKLILIGC